MFASEEVCLVVVLLQVGSFAPHSKLSANEVSSSSVVKLAVVVVEVVGDDVVVDDDVVVTVSKELFLVVD